MKEDIVAFINDMLDALTWSRVGLFFLAGIVLIAVLMFYENRNRFIDFVFGNTSVEAVENLSQPWELSEKSKAELKKLTEQPLVGGVLITEVNLKKNRRITKYWYVQDPAFRNDVVQILSTLLPQPFFDTDVKNNEQMLGVLGNQFTCTPTSQTVFNNIFPSMAAKLPWVCRLAVPPYVGEFAGFITLALVRAPTYTEKEALKIELARISINLYLRDIESKR